MLLVGIAADTHEAIAIAREIHPDVAIVDASMPRCLVGTERR